MASGEDWRALTRRVTAVQFFSYFRGDVPAVLRSAKRSFFTTVNGVFFVRESQARREGLATASNGIDPRMPGRHRPSDEADHWIGQIGFSSLAVQFQASPGQFSSRRFMRPWVVLTVVADLEADCKKRVAHPFNGNRWLTNHFEKGIGASATFTYVTENSFCGQPVVQRTRQA